MGQTDLTTGSIYKSLVKYAAPVVGSNLLQALYGLVDTIVAGQFIGSAALSGLTNANMVITMFTQILVGLCMGGGILIGQYYGARDTRNSHESTVTLFTGSLVAGLMAVVILFFGSRLLLILLGAPALEEADVYLRTCAVGFFFIAGYNGAAAALRAVGNSKAPLICIAATAAVNVVLDVLFVAGFGMGVFGAALATVISQAMSFFVAVYFLIRSPEVFGVRLGKLYLRRDKLRQELKLGLPCAVQMSVAAISWLSVTFLINSYGITVSAGNGVSNRIKEFCQLFITAMTTATSSMIAQNMGAGHYDRARQTMYSAMKITVAMAVFIIALVQCLAPQMVSLFTTDAPTAEAAVHNLRVEIFGQVFYAVFLVYHGLMLGSGDTWFVFLSSFINCILARITLGVTFNHFWGLEGVYYACMIAPFTSVPFGIWYDRSGRWRRSLIRE